MRNIDKLKKYIKETATQIRITRAHHKEAQRDGQINRANKFLRELHGLQYEYRHHHIAYCELRGKTRLQIEPKIREHNEPNDSYIKQLKEKYAWTPEEIEAYEERKEARNEAICAHP